MNPQQFHSMFSGFNVGVSHAIMQHGQELKKSLEHLLKEINSLPFKISNPEVSFTMDTPGRPTIWFEFAVSCETKEDANSIHGSLRMFFQTILDMVILSVADKKVGIIFEGAFS